jgi:hypothetical protein
MYCLRRAWLAFQSHLCEAVRLNGGAAVADEEFPSRGAEFQSHLCEAVRLNDSAINHLRNQPSHPAGPSPTERTSYASGAEFRKPTSLTASKAHVGGGFKRRSRLASNSFQGIHGFANLFHFARQRRFAKTANPPAANSLIPGGTNPVSPAKLRKPRSGRRPLRGLRKNGRGLPARSIS